MKTKQLLVVLGLCLFWSILSLCTVILLGCGNAEDATVTGGEDTTIADGDDANIIGKIAFHSNRDGDSDIYVMDADSGNVVNLTKRKEQPMNCGTREAFLNLRLDMVFAHKKWHYKSIEPSICDNDHYWIFGSSISFSKRHYHKWGTKSK